MKEYVMDDCSTVGKSTTLHLGSHLDFACEKLQKSEMSFIPGDHLSQSKITKLMDGKACADIFFIFKPALLPITSIKCFLLLLQLCNTCKVFWLIYLYKTVAAYFWDAFLESFFFFLFSSCQTIKEDWSQDKIIFFSKKIKTYRNSLFFNVASAFWILSEATSTSTCIKKYNFFSWIFKKLQEISSLILKGN